MILFNSFRGAKTETLTNQILKTKGEFTLSEIMLKCPDVSKDMIRKILKDLKNNGKIMSKGRGPGARWIKKGKNL